MILMQNGSPCFGAENDHASTAIRLICDSSVSGYGQRLGSPYCAKLIIWIGTPQLIAELPGPDDSACAFVIEWRTPVSGATRIV